MNKEGVFGERRLKGVNRNSRHHWRIRRDQFCPFHKLHAMVSMHDDWTRPLQSAVAVIGSSVYLLGLDIHTYHSGTLLSHAFYAINLAAFIASGDLLNVQGMANVGKTYLGLFLFTMYCEMKPRSHLGSESLIVGVWPLRRGIRGIVVPQQ